MLDFPLFPCLARGRRTGREMANAWWRGVRNGAMAGGYARGVCGQTKMAVCSAASGTQCRELPGPSLVPPAPSGYTFEGRRPLLPCWCSNSRWRADPWLCCVFRGRGLPLRSAILGRKSGPWYKAEEEAQYPWYMLEPGTGTVPRREQVEWLSSLGATRWRVSREGSGELAGS